MSDFFSLAKESTSTMPSILQRHAHRTFKASSTVSQPENHPTRGKSLPHVSVSPPRLYPTSPKLERHINELEESSSLRTMLRACYQPLGEGPSTFIRQALMRSGPIMVRSHEKSMEAMPDFEFLGNYFIGSVMFINVQTLASAHFLSN